DIFTGDEIIADTYKLIDVPGNALWEVDCKQYMKGKTDFQLEGANPSAEDDEEGGDEDGEAKMVLDIEESFQLSKLESKPSKDEFKKSLKSYIGRVNKKLKEQGAPEADIKEFQTNGTAAFKKIIANYDNYDVYFGSSFDPDGMWVLIDYREDGTTPYATFWRHGLKGMKV
ncbi:major facilitator super transporter protein, partial [Ascosphaera pollenicola]